jgi:hypothetical protein
LSAKNSTNSSAPLATSTGCCSTCSPPGSATSPAAPAARSRTPRRRAETAGPAQRGGQRQQAAMSMPLVAWPARSATSPAASLTVVHGQARAGPRTAATGRSRPGCSWCWLGVGSALLGGGAMNGQPCAIVRPQPGRLALLQEGLHAFLALGAGADVGDARRWRRSAAR